MALQVYWCVLFLTFTLRLYCWPCPQDVTRVYARPGSRAVLAFQTTIQESGSIVYYVTAYNGSNLYKGTFYDGVLEQTLQYLNSTFIGNAATGNFTIQTNNLQTMDAGVYRLQHFASAFITDKCSTLYILGIPTQPNIQSSNDPSVGDDAKLTCESTSTTVPTNHSLNRSYNWNVDNSAVTASGKYSLSGKTLVVSNVAKIDKDLKFTCTSTEVITNGYTSYSSGEYSVNVLYGPDVVTLTPSNTSYIVDQATTLTDVKCYADCNPVCTYKWTKQGQTTAVSNTDTLPLDSIDKSYIGAYTCTATNADRAVTKNSPQVRLNVRYGPDTATLDPVHTAYTVNSGATLNDITCTGDCYPDCSYKWTKPGGGVDVSSTGVLSLGSLVRSDAAIYTCTVTNPSTGDSTTKEVTVNVRYGPDAGTTTLNPADTTYTQNEGTNLNDITCVGDCYPACSYKWTQSGTTVSTTDVLSLETLNRNEAAIYTCTVTNPGKSGSVSKQVTVNVRYGPDTAILTPAAPSYTRNASTVLPDITCASDCYPTCNIKWTNSGSVISNTGVLSLGTLDKNDAATYTCTVSNPGMSATVTKHVEIFVRYGPDRCDISVQSPYTLREGNSIPTITCQSVCYPACSQGWSNVSINSPVGSDGDLSLGMVSRYKAGEYSCTCSNIDQEHYDKSLHNTVQVIVQYPPDVNVILSTTDISEGNELLLTCDAKGVPLVYNYTRLSQTWDNSVIHNIHTAASGTPMYSSLRIPSLQLQDSGTYTCRVNNGITNTQGVLEDSVETVFIKVKVSPKIITQGLTFTGVTGGTANFRVEFYSYPDILNVTFKRYNGSAITNGGKYNVSHHGTEVTDKFYGTDVTLNGSQANMVISDLKPEDFGVYTLTLSNQLSTTDADVMLVSESKPDKPTQFTYLYKDNAHILSWIGGFNGGHSQTFLLQTSIVGTEEWVNRTTIAEREDLYLQYSANISNLQPGTYTARIYSWNTKGRTNDVNLNVTFTIKPPDEMLFPWAAVAGGTSSAVLVLVIVVVVVVLYKRRYKNKGGSQAKLQNRDLNGNHNEDSDDEDEVNTVNPMYVSADEVQPGSSGDNTYAVPIKKQQKNDVYAMVYKKPTADESDGMSLYAMPNKKDQKKQQKQEAKKAKKEKNKQQVDGDIYENAPEAAFGANKSGSQVGHDENLYEDAQASVSDQNPKKNLNIEGLIYADLTFKNQPKGPTKLVIHGLDSMTDYVQVDFTKKADPLPDSDEEKEK